MRKCKCNADMEFVGSNSDGRYWCPKCGRYSQSYACGKTIWKEPIISNAVPIDARPLLTDDKIQELREIFFDSGSSRNYQNKKIKEWFDLNFLDNAKLTDITSLLAELKKLDCGSHSCRFSYDKTGQRSNSGCFCLKSLTAGLRTEIEKLWYYFV